MELDQLTGKIIGCAIEVHNTLGPGLLESSYEQCLAYELNLNNIKFKSQLSMPVIYKGISLEAGYRIDFLIEDRVIVELKSVEALNPIHMAQILTYMKLANIKTGLLFNFNIEKLKNGIKRLVL